MRQATGDLGRWWGAGMQGQIQDCRLKDVHNVLAALRRDIFGVIEAA
jgi:hypothetical protein